MRTPALFALLPWTLVTLAQVNISTTVVLTGAETDKAIDGLAPPASGDAAITVEGSVRSEWSWATAAVQGTAISLVTTPGVTDLRDGLLLRFVAPTNVSGAITLSVDGLAPLDLLRPDGLRPVVGQLVQGRVCEVMLAGGVYHLMNATEKGCPPGFLPVNSNYCVEINSSGATDWLTATDICNNKGGQLCTWGEYHAACYALQGQLTNLFVDYEWLDDTSNHTHGANQVARVNCYQHRTRLLTVPARTRCCFHIR